jgi:hypothetical protein
MTPSELASWIWRTYGRRTAVHAVTLIQNRAYAEDARKRFPVMLDGHTGEHLPVSAGRPMTSHSEQGHRR